MGSESHTLAVTFVFTDIEGSTRLWDTDRARMAEALARHDELCRDTIDAHGGRIVKMTGDGMHAAFSDPAAALSAALDLQRAMVAIAAQCGIPLKMRCGLHAGVSEARDNDYFGGTVNRAARIMGAAHGGQILVSQSVVELAKGHLPEGTDLVHLGRVRLRDLSSAEDLWQLLHPDLPRAFPALRSLEVTPNNLPLQLTSFIGRERELMDARELLGRTRLLTLVGAGGIGKTRFSLQLAAEVTEDYPDGVWFVELASVADARMVVQATATVLGVKEEAGRPVREAVIKAVKDRRLLLVLDNCEHLVEACAELVTDLLQTGPQVRIISSSREPLRVGGETTYSMPALRFPLEHQIAAAESLMRFEAVQLFMERAVAALPTFRITERNAAHLVAICRHLDGIPLAIELAAARLRTMSVERIAKRLTDRFRLLTGGPRTAMPRQQTLRALIDWSYDLLTEEERALFRRLAAFAGGWTFEAAEAVGAGGDIGEQDILDLLPRLVEKSLVVMDAEHERYHLLETIREYALERLEIAGETGEIRGRHRDYFLAHTERVFPKLFGEGQLTWLAGLDRELDNLLAAHAWCGKDPDGGELDLRLVHAMKPYYYNRGLLGLALQITTEALEHPGVAERSFLRCRGLFDAGQLYSFMGRYEIAQKYLEQSLAIAREIDDRQRIASVLQPLGMAALGRGDLATARGYLLEALSMAREIGNRRELAAAFNALAQFHRVTGDMDAAEPLYRQVEEITRDLGDDETMAIALLNLAMVATTRGDVDAGRALLVETLHIHARIGSRPIGQSLIEVSAGLAARQSEWLRSARYYGIAEAHAHRTGIHRDPADEAFLSPRIKAARAALSNDDFAAAEASGRALAYEKGLEEVRAWLGGDV